MALADGLVGYWSAWLGSSGYRLLDRTGRGFHATGGNYNGSEHEGATVLGKSGRVLRHGSPFDKFLNCGNVPVNIDNTPFSVSIWFRSDVLQAQSLVAKSLLGASTNRWFVWATASGIDAYGPSGVGTSTASHSTSYNDGRFHFVTVTYYGTSMRLYYDGIFRSTATITQLGSNTNSLLFGRYNDGSGGATSNNSPFNGWIAEVCCWQSLLPDAAVRELYRLGPGWYQPYKKRGYGYAAAVAGFKPYWHRRETQIIGGGLR